MSREPVSVSGVTVRTLEKVDTELKDDRIWPNETESESSEEWRHWKYVFHIHEQKPTYDRSYAQQDFKTNWLKF